MSIEILESNRPPARFYRGGRRIAEFRGIGPVGEREPEDWVGSVTTVRGEAPAGLSHLAGGERVADAIARDPDGWLGAAHVAAYGPDPMLLVKLLDAGERLPVHAHPGRAFAAEHLGLAHGKTEAWCILTPGTVHLGLVRDLAERELAGMLEGQDAAEMLGAMHRLEVGPSDVVHVPAGVLHAIGEGILLVELQEPEDVSILVEWAGFAIDGPALGHLGLGFDRALGAIETRARTADEIAALVHRAGSAGPLLPAEADPFFRVERVTVDGRAELSPGLAVVVVLDGEVALAAAGSEPEVVAGSVAAGSEPEVAAGSAAAEGEHRVGRGTTALVPHRAGPVRVSGRGELLVCRPPSPSAG